MLFPYVQKENGAEVERFPSISEIATRYFHHNHQVWYEKNVINLISEKLPKLDAVENDSTIDEYEKKKLKKEIDDGDLIQKIKAEFNTVEKKEFFARHKYICIVQSDGDGVGSYLKNEVQNEVKLLKDFSGKLNKFSIEASQVITDYGAVPVYAGGDDLLFFAPVMKKDESSTIIELLLSLDSKFKDEFRNTTMSQSFGVKLMYYKHPMAEGIDSAVKLLYDKAKSQKNKNYIALDMELHSGASFSLGYNLKTESFQAFLALLRQSQKDKSSFLNSVMYKLDDQHEVIKLIKDDSERLTLFFEQNFNEVYKKYTPFFQALTALIVESYKEFSQEKDDTLAKDDDIINSIYGSLRFIQFLNAEDHD